MGNFTLEDLESKYPGVSEKEGWFDLHLKRGTREISDEAFKNELIIFGLDESDAHRYIDLLNRVNESIEDFTEESKIFEMLEIRIKYENLIEKESELKDLIRAEKLEYVNEILSKDLQMSIQEIDIIIKSLRYEINNE
jgi:hypothetical protein